MKRELKQNNHVTMSAGPFESCLLFQFLTVNLIILVSFSNNKVKQKEKIAVQLRSWGLHNESFHLES